MVQPESTEEIALDRLIEAVTPLLTVYLENQAKQIDHQAKHRERDLAFQEKMLEHGSRRHRVTVVAAAGIAALILGFAGFLVWNGRDAIAVDIIKTIVTLASVAFGGYGVALSTQKKRGERDED